MKVLYSISLALLVCVGYSQHSIGVGCGQHRLLREMLKSPERLKIHLAEQKILEEHEKKMLAQKTKGIVYTIPIVFHVIHNGGIENISDAQILDGLNVLNEDFRKLNSDASTVNPAFQGLPADVEVQFVLATIAPDGSCFSGITRTPSPNSYVSNFSGGNDQINDIINGNDVFQGNWSSHNYLNVVVCGNPSDGVAGYTNYPSNSFGNSMNASIWMRHDYVGTIGTGNSLGGRTLTHEAGHWLNLAHTWGSTNEPGLASNCNTDDNVIDTPNTIGTTWCNQNDTSCGPLGNTENYMNYASCRKMFTPGQANRMRAALTSSVGGRDNLWQTSNLIATGTLSAPTLCNVNFETNKPVICSGDSVAFTDLSFHNISSWNWDFPGGSPSTSNLQNPTVVYNSPGVFPVTLTASDGNTSISETKNNFIGVLQGLGAPIPFQEGFENPISVDDNWFPNSSLWEVSTGSSSSGNNSIKLDNFNGTSNYKYELESNTIDLSNESAVTIGFKYAFANTSSSNTDQFQILGSWDCGETWYVRKNISNSQLTTANNTGFPYSPQPSHWKQVYINNIINSFCVENFKFKFSLKSGGGNNLYIDDINIFPSSSLDVNQLSQSIEAYPNPSSDLLNIKSTEYPLKQVTVFDLSGRAVAVIENLNSKLISLKVSSWNSGLYIVKVVTSIGTSIVPFEKLGP